MENFKTILHDFKNSGWVVLLEMSYFAWMKLLEMGKDMKIKHGVSSPPYKVRGNFIHKKSLHGGTNVFGKIYGGMLYMGTND